LDIHFIIGTFCESAAPLAEKNAAARHHVLRSLSELPAKELRHLSRKMPPHGTTY
jgi:hypothetical protein